MSRRHKKKKKKKKMEEDGRHPKRQQRRRVGKTQNETKRNVSVDPLPQPQKKIEKKENSSCSRHSVKWKKINWITFELEYSVGLGWLG